MQHSLSNHRRFRKNSTLPAPGLSVFFTHADNGFANHHQPRRRPTTIKATPITNALTLNHTPVVKAREA